MPPKENKEKEKGRVEAAKFEQRQKERRRKNGIWPQRSLKKEKEE